MRIPFLSPPLPPPPPPPPGLWLNTVALATLAPVVLVLVLRWRRRNANILSKIHADHAAADGRAAARRRQQSAHRGPRSVDVTVRLEECRQLCRRNKYLEACEDLDWLRKTLPAVNEAIRWPSKEQIAARSLARMLAKDGELALLESRGRVCREAIDTFTGDPKGWDETLGSDGTKVSSRIRPMEGPNNMIDIKVEAELDDIRCEHTLYCFREGDLYPSWFPYVSHGAFVREHSATEARPGR